MVENIIKHSDLLREQPKLGRKVPELDDPHVRECFVYSYRLIYEIKDTNIHVLGIIHGKQLLESVERFNQE